MGYQYLTLAHILLVVYDPGIPRVGPAHRAAIMKVDVSLKIRIGTEGLTFSFSLRSKGMCGFFVA